MDSLPTPAAVQRDPADARATPIRLRRELLAEGWHDRAIAHQVRSGAWVRPRRGAYASSAAWESLDAAGRHELVTRAVLRAANTDLVVSHSSAVPFHDAPVWHLDLSAVHVTRTDGRSGHDEAGVHQHRGKMLDGDLTVRHGVPVMSAARTALEVTTMADAEPALVVMNHLCHAGATTPQQIRERYDDSMEQWPHTLKTDLVIRLCDPRVESVGETRFVWLCFRHGLPAPIPQYVVRDPSGAIVAILDFAWPELKAFAEFDGRVKYQQLLRPGQDPSEVVVREKQREDKVRELTGFRCMRVVWDDYRRPEHTALRVRRLLEGGSSVMNDPAA